MHRRGGSGAISVGGAWAAIVRQSLDDMKNEVLTPFLATKTQRPRRSPGLIERKRLLGLLERAQSCRLTIIKGAAGFGKTSLAISWAEKLQRAGHAVAWVSLDVEDDEPTQFLCCLAHVLRAACNGMGKPTIDLIAEIMLIRPQDLVRSLINSLAEVEGDVFLFLDDYHVLTDPGIDESVAYLLRHAPSNLHLVITTRVEPKLPLGRLRAQNQLLEIDGAALRFDLDETRQFMEQEVATRLDPAQTRSLHDKTEGWPAMMRIVVATSAQSGQEFGQYVRQLSSRMRPIRSYLIEMLEGLPEELVGFLLRVSILDRLCADLCRAVSGVAASQSLLDDIATRRLLLIPLDQDGTWFRCHPLLRGFLQQRLEAERPDDIPELHRRAYAWYAEAGLWTDAIQHATAVGDTAQAIGWIENCAMALLKRGELLTLLAWERLIPASLMQRQIKVRLAIAWGMALAMRFDEALKLTADIERDLVQAPGNDDPLVVESISCDCQAIRSVALGLSDDTDAGLKLAEECLRRQSSGRWTANVAANVMVLGYLNRRDLSPCYAQPWIALSGDDGSHNVVATVYRSCLLGLVEYQQLRIPAAARLFNDGLRVAQAYSGAHSVGAAMPASLLAQMQYDQGLLDEAEAMVIDRLPVIDAACMLECLVRAYLVLVRVALHRGNAERAYTLLDQAETLGKSRRWGRLVARMGGERVRINLTERRLAQADIGVRQLADLATAYPAPVRCAWSDIHDAADLARAHLLAAQGDHAGSAAILHRLHQAANATRQDEIAMGLAIHLAAARWQAGEASEAVVLCHQAVLAAGPAGLSQPFRDADPAILAVLRRLREEMQHAGEGLSFIDTLIGSSPTPVADMAGSEPLSPREQGVLALLVEGQSNKDIARTLSIAPETVKSHVKSIFLKLGVINRAQAVSRALSLGLVNAG